MADAGPAGLSPDSLHRGGALADDPAGDLPAPSRIQFPVPLRDHRGAGDDHFPLHVLLAGVRGDGGGARGALDRQRRPSPHQLGVHPQHAHRYLRRHVVLEVVTWAIIVVAATVLHGNGATNIGTAADAARALLPLVHTFPNAGFIAQALFATGIIGLGLLAIPVLAGSASYAVSESLQWVEGLDQKLTKAWGFYGVIIVAMLLGLLLNFTGINPIRALVFAAVLNGLVAVPLIFVIALIARNKNIMGQYKSGWFSNLLVWLTFLGMGAAAIAMFATLGH